MVGKLFGLLLVALALCVVPATSVSAADDLSGTYTCVGENADGGQYKGTVTISKEGAAYNLKWTIAGNSHVGLAIREGDSLSSCWLVGDTGGIVVYKIQAGGKLVGKWCQFGTNGSVLTETLTRDAD